jgi:hypothetical protein
MTGGSRAGSLKRSVGHQRMTTPDNKCRSRGVLIPLVTTLALVLTVAALCTIHGSRPRSAPADIASFVERLKSAKHVQSSLPAQKQTVDLAKKSSLRHAALNAIGMELRNVPGLQNGDPELVFSMLSHLGGFGEIIWVGQWTNFPVKLPPGQDDFPRRDAVRAMLDAIDASGGCLVKAGEKRYLVARVSEKEQFEAAIRSLGWMDGGKPPWYTDESRIPPKSEPGAAANRSQPVCTETTRTSMAAGSGR